MFQSIFTAGKTQSPMADISHTQYSQASSVIAQPLMAQLLEISERFELDISAIFQGMMACLVSSYRNDLEILCGCSINRNRSPKKALCPLLPLSLNLDLRANVGKWISDINDQWSKIENAQDALIADREKKPSNGCYSPQFQSLLIITEEALCEPDIEGIGTQYADVPLLIFIYTDSNLTLTIQSDQHVDGFNTAEALLNQCQNWLENLCSQIELPLSSLDFLSASDREILLFTRNLTTTEYPRNQTIQTVFEQQTQHRPDHIAVLLPDLRGQQHQQLTYQELNQRANCLSQVLQQQDVQPGTYVAVMMERSIEMIVALVGILKAGGVYVPLDPAYPADRLEWMLTDTQTPIVLTQTDLVQQLPPHPGTVLCLDAGWGTDVSTDEPAPTPVELDAEALAYINYTSGSTGRPKGVAIPHRAVLRLVFGNDYTPLDAQQTWLQLAPISFDAATLEIWGALLQGGRCVLFPENGLPDPQDLKTVIAHHGVTSLWLTASLFNTLISECPQVLQGVKEVLTGGEALSVSHVRQAQRHLPQTQFVNGYGPTENTTFTCCYRIPAPLPADLTSIPIGKPIGNTQVYILDGAGRPVPMGQPGELYVGGDGLATEYINRPDLTQSRFVPHPFRDDPQARLYKTGDLVRYLPDGNIEFLGRVDNQVKIRGYRIELGEIEAALRQHDAVRDAIAIVHQNHLAQKQLVGYVTAVADVSLDVGHIQAYLRQCLPAYMVPTILMVLEAIPLTPNGKVDRRSLPEPTFALTANFIAPQTPLEKSLAEVWCQVLGLGQVGIEDNFFDVGGTSILSLQVATRLTTQLGHTVRAVKLYQYPTIRTLAQYLSPTQQPAVAPDSQRQSPSPAALATDGIAIVGMVGRFPGADTVEDLWSNLCNGLESITFFEDNQIDPSVDLDLRTDPHYVRAKGVVQGAEFFDAAFFGISPRQAEIMAPQARLFLELAQAALENAGYTPSQYSGRVGLYAGSGQNTYFERHICGRSEIINRLGAFQTMLANEKDFVTTRTSYKLDLTGPSVSVSTACSTSLVATIQAFQGLLNQDCDLALAGGISITTPQNTGYLYQEEGILSPDGHCRPFDAQAQGTTFNSGAGIVVLKRLADAVEDGDRIYAVLKGVGLNNDGASKVSFTAPSVEGQTEAIIQAQVQAGFTPESISYVEAHGTATSLGDPIEVEALTQAFQQPPSGQHYCALGSIKGNIGHTVAAAGVAGLIKTALALYYKTIPPSLGFRAPNPQIDFEHSPFYVNTQRAPWPAGQTPRRAGVSSFGVGGTNAHVVLEEPPDLAPSSPARPWHLLLLSAQTASALEQATSNLHQFCQAHDDLVLADVAYTLQVGRQAYNHRRFVLCQGGSDAAPALAALDVDYSGTRQTLRRHPDIVFVFPGQGSQYVNMGLDFYQSEPVFQKVVDRCAESLEPYLKLDIRTLLYPQPGGEDAAATELKKTIYTQPALFVVEYALAQLWMSWGVQPAAMVGHSIGEFVAACLAGVFSLEEGLKLIAARGQMMWELPAGSMLSVRSSVDQVQPYVTNHLAIAAINSPGLCVISGPTPDISALEATLTTQDIACKILHTSHAFHSSMMDEIVGPFQALVQDLSLSPPQIPFVSTATADWITDSQATDPKYWADHLRATVRFADSVQTLWQQPDRILLEVGPRTTTTTLARQQIKDQQVQHAIASLSHTAEDHQEWAAILKAMGQLWLAGTQIDWSTFYQNEYRHRLPLPTYPFERQRFWIDPLPAPLTSTDPLPAPTASPIDNAVPILQSPDSVERPQTPMSATRPQRLSPLITEILETSSGMDLSEVSEQVTFLEMGLDSLSLTQVALSLKKKFKVKLSFRNLLEEYCTVQSVADYLDQSLPADAFPPPPPSAASSLPEAASAPVLDVPTTIASQPLPPINSAQSSAVETLVAQQLQILSQQLTLLTQDRQGSAVASTNPVSAATAPPQPLPSTSAAVPKVVSNEAAPKSHGPGAKIQTSQGTTLSPQQRDFLDRLIADYTASTPESKRQAQEHRPYLADPRTVSGFTPLLKEMIYPLVIERSSGSKLWDVDGNEYVDITNGFGLNFFGWNPDFVTQAIIDQLQKGIEIGPQHPLAGRVAKLISEFTGMDRVAFCNTGSEAVMASLRLARTVTGRDLVVTFKGDYHGTFDEVLYRPGAKQKTLPAAPGIMPSMFENLLVLDYGTPESLDIIRQKAEDIAAVLVEPVRSRDPGLQPHEFLQELRRITTQSEIALIFDEVVTGFRVHPGGAQAYFGIQADLATYGKIVGGGLPIGIVAGKADYMDALDGGQWQFGDNSVPEVGVTFFAGTFVRHPMALAAAEAILTKLKALGPTPQQQLADKVSQFTSHLSQFCQQAGVPVFIKSFSSFFYITYGDEAPYGGLLFYLLRAKGVHVWEFRPCFFTLAHADADIAFITRAFKNSISELQSAGFLPGQTTPEDNSNQPQQQPPCSGARLGRDPQGHPAWFIADPDRPGQYLQVGAVS